MDPDFIQFERMFYADGYRLGSEAAEAGLSKEAVYKAVSRMHALLDEFLNSFNSFAQQNGRLPACKKGCHWCCHQPVYALSYELDMLNDYIERELDEETRRQIRIRALDKSNRLADLTPDEVLNSKIPCPLLENGICMAYTVRPVACRIYLSSSLPSCLAFYHEPRRDDSIPALLQFPLNVGRMLNEGLKNGFKDKGMNIEEFRIDEKLGDAGIGS